MKQGKGSSFALGTTLIFIINFQSHGLPLKKDQLLCDPLEHKYYLTQFGVCSDCDKCFPGDEIEPLEGADVGIGLHGATLCLGCQQCREGTFNSEQNLQWYCSPCTVCADLGMVEIEPCTPTRDTICSDTPPDIQPHLNGKTNSSMVLPYKYRDKQGDLRFYGEFLAITALSLIFLISVAIAVCFWRKKHRRIPVTGGKLTRFQAVPKADVCVSTDSSLHDIQEEHSGGEDDALIPPCKLRKLSDTSKRKIKEKINYMDPNLRRRRQSCQPVSTLPKIVDLQDKSKELRVFGFRRQRLKSLPVTNPELNDCKSSFCQRPPSDGFIQFLSKLLAGDRVYRHFAKETGLEEFNIKLTETEFEGRHIADISYEVIKKILQKRPNLTVMNVYDILDKMGLQEGRKLLKDNIEKFKISLT
uniref:TNFR1 n=1 Tax=Mizuhopecten yessoensis TaxID=6573 RepID=A0A142IJP9_MIZYE|nr:TNFR1 [Mizuhopecten yessoensis]